MALGFRSRLKASIEEDYRFLVRMLGEYPHYINTYKISQDDDGLVFTLSKEGKKEQRVVNYRLDGLGHPDITATICSFFIALNQGQ